MNWISQAKTYPPKSHFFQLSQEEKEKLETLGYLNIQKNDDDNDGVSNEQDNCVDKPNGPMKGMCTSGYSGESCTNNDQCGVDGFCSMDQEDDDKMVLEMPVTSVKVMVPMILMKMGCATRKTIVIMFLTPTSRTAMVMALGMHVCLLLWKPFGSRQSMQI